MARRQALTWRLPFLSFSAIGDDNALGSNEFVLIPSQALE
jgi:hypothetical protein